MEGCATGLYIQIGNQVPIGSVLLKINPIIFAISV